MGNKRVAMIAGGVCKWGPRQATFRDLISEAGKDCYDSNTNIKPSDIDGMVLCSVYPERSAYQGKPAPLASECLGVKPKFFQRVENMCGTGTVGIRTAVAAINAGYAEVVMVVGAEKMYVPNPSEILSNAAGGLDREWESCLGVTPPGAFALNAKAHMERFGTTEKQLAMVCYKNHQNSLKNPYAHYHKGPSLEKIMSSKLIAWPFKLYDCSSITDGSAALIFSTEERAKDLCKDPVWVLGTGQGFTSYTMANMDRDWSHWNAVKLAGERAYQSAGIGPDDIDLAEVHDCFSISEIIYYEELGFCEKGEGGHFIESGKADYGGKVVVNPRGGLLGCGHPLGATGCAQAHEMFLQLRNNAGERQVKDAKIGLTSTMSNIGSESHTIIFGRNM